MDGQEAQRCSAVARRVARDTEDLVVDGFGAEPMALGIAEHRADGGDVDQGADTIALGVAGLLVAVRIDEQRVDPLGGVRGKPDVREMLRGNLELFFAPSDDLFGQQHPLPRSSVLMLWIFCVAVDATGFRAKDVVERVERVEQVPRVAAGTVVGSELLEKYILADRPVVISRAVSSVVLDRIRAAGYWAPGGTPSWFHDVLASFDGADVMTYGNESLRGRSNLPFGCERTAKQCTVAWWYSGALPSSYRTRGAPAGGGAGAYVHTDALCAPSWSLQVDGVKEWTFAQRTPSEAAVPLGDEFLGQVAVTTRMEPGDLLLFFNGWHPHSTNPVDEDEFTSSVHGVIAFEDMGRRLWGRDGVAAKVSPTHLASPSPRLLDFCPTVRAFGGFDATNDTDAACAPPPPRLWNDQFPFGDLGSLGYLSVPAAADFDGDGLVDLVVGSADGALRYFRNFGTTTEPAFKAGPSPYDALRSATTSRLAHVAPSPGDLDADGAADLAVGLYDGTIVFLTFKNEEWAVLRPALDTAMLRPSPLLLDGDMLVGSESGELVLVNDVLRNDKASPIQTSGMGNKFSVLRLAVWRRPPGPATIAVGDGGVQIVRYAKLDGHTLRAASAVPSPLAGLDLDELNDNVPIEIAAYPAPTLADFDGDGVDDLLLGGLYGTLLFFNGAEAVDEHFVFSDE